MKYRWIAAAATVAGAMGMACGQAADAPSPRDEAPDSVEHVVASSAETAGALGVVEWRPTVGADAQWYLRGRDSKGAVRVEIATWASDGQGGVAVNLGKGISYFRYETVGDQTRVTQNDLASAPDAARALRLAKADLETSAGGPSPTIGTAALRPANVPGGGLTTGIPNKLTKDCTERKLPGDGKTCRELIDTANANRIAKAEGCTQYGCLDGKGTGWLQERPFTEAELDAKGCIETFDGVDPVCMAAADTTEQRVNDNCKHCMTPEDVRAATPPITVDEVEVGRGG